MPFVVDFLALFSPIWNETHATHETGYRSGTTYLPLGESHKIELACLHPVAPLPPLPAGVR